MNLYDLLQIIKKNDPHSDFGLIKKAYKFAKKAHDGQKRATGEPYIIHPFNTAINLAKTGLDVTTIAAGLLHDVPEDTDTTLEEIKKEFGDEIANLVMRITKLGRIKYRGIERYIENLRKMFIAMAEDIRVIFIKFADRLHNLETLKALPKEKRLRIARETLEIYVPIASRIGMSEIKGLLENLAFSYVYPEEFTKLNKLISKQYQYRFKLIENVTGILKKSLKESDLKFISIKGRAKHLYSIYQKLLRHNREILKIHDIVALRIIVKDIPSCYATLGTIHKLWKPLKGRIKDYISQPKPNGYQSLHTTVFCERETVEFQIRTVEMDENAEYGIAAHWNYAEHGSTVPKKNIQWVQELTAWKKEVADDKKFIETLKIDVFQNRIFVFTPKGDVIDLPEESTAIDFAYHIHSEVGDKCISARVNDQMSNLERKLKSGDMVEIITNPQKKGPTRNWLKFAKTNLAKTRIRNTTKGS
ncbi:RelA/SpoT family protein [Patescibacteria group bacterium]